MKILANENFPLLAVEALRDAGHDVVWARTDMPGEADEQLLRRAQEELRLPVTFDKDFAYGPLIMAKNACRLTSTVLPQALTRFPFGDDSSGLTLSAGASPQSRSNALTGLTQRTPQPSLLRRMAWLRLAASFQA